MITQALLGKALMALMLICIIQGVSLTDPTHLPTILYHEHITHSKGTYFHDELPIPPSKKIIINYHITFRSEKCCPAITFKRLTGKQSVTKAYFLGCSSRNLRYVAIYSPVLIYTEEKFTNSGCQVTEGIYTCNGTRTFSSTSPVKWKLAVLYICGTEQNLDVKVHFEINYITIYTFPCEPMILSYCSKIMGYNYTAFPNAIGQLHQQDSNKIMSLVQLKSFTSALKSCYQHGLVFTCRALFPKCHKGSHLMPCYQMCNEAVEGCQSYLMAVGQPLDCGWLQEMPDVDVCFYEPVKCLRPQPPEFGSLVAEGLLRMNITRYYCNHGYTLKGDAERHCEFSGEWNGTSPICISEGFMKKLSLLQTVLVPILMLVVLVGTIITLSIYHRHELFLCIFHNRYIIFLKKNNQPLVRQRKLFVSFSSEDLDTVRERFIPELRQWLPTWSTVTYQEDFTPGRPVLECINEAVWESQAVLVLLTENFINSPFCRFEFTEAETRSVIDQNFKLIVVLLTEDACKMHNEYTADLPENLREYVRSRVHLLLGEQLFWNKLHRALSKVGYPADQNTQPVPIVNMPI